MATADWLQSESVPLQGNSRIYDMNRQLLSALRAYTCRRVTQIFEVAWPDAALEVFVIVVDIDVICAHPDAQIGLHSSLEFGHVFHANSNHLVLVTEQGWILLNIESKLVS